MPRRDAWAPRAAWMACLCCAALAAMPGCGARPDARYVTAAYELGLDYHWDEARPLLRRYLMFHPEDAAAHFLLGRYYLHQAQPFLVVAEGQLRAALMHYERAGQWEALAPHKTADQFEAAIYRELARVNMRRVYEVLSYAVPERVIQRYLDEALQYVELGLKLDPESQTLLEMRGTLRAIMDGEAPPDLDRPGEAEPDEKPARDEPKRRLRA